MTLSQKIINTPLGNLLVRASSTHLRELRFADTAEIYQSNEGDLHNPILDQTHFELSEYFAGKRRVFTIPLAPDGTEFQKKAWKALEKIPYGETRSYKEEALLAGNAKAIRAIGGANNKNPIAIIIPCHRVIGANGSLVGYAGGIERKKWLLKHEKSHML